MNYESIFESVFGTVWLRHGDEYKVSCFVCGHKSLWLNPMKNVCYCFVCGFADRIDRLVPDMAGLRLRSAVVAQELTPVVSRIGAGLPARYRAVVKRGDFPEGWDYVVRRGVNPEEVEFGFIDEFSVCFPVREDGKVVYWQTRSIYPELKKKTMNPARSASVIGRSEIVYRLDVIESGCPVIVVEGVFDALRSGGVATLGKRCTEIQVMKIVRRLPSIVFICYDGDAHAECSEAAEMFMRVNHGVLTVPVFLPDGKDPADLGKDLLRALIKVQFHHSVLAPFYRLPQFSSIHAKSWLD